MRHIKAIFYNKTRYLKRSQTTKSLKFVFFRNFLPFNDHITFMVLYDMFSKLLQQYLELWRIGKETDSK